MTKYLIMINFTSNLLCQQLQFNSNLLPTDATTDSIKYVVTELLDAISTNDSTKAKRLVIEEGHVTVSYTHLTLPTTPYV